MTDRQADLASLWQCKWVHTDTVLTIFCHYAFYFYPLDANSFFALFKYFDLAADVLAENAHLTYKFLTPVSEF